MAYSCVLPEMERLQSLDLTDIDGGWSKIISRWASINRENLREVELSFCLMCCILQDALDSGWKLRTNRISTTEDEGTTKRIERIKKILDLRVRELQRNGKLRKDLLEIAAEKDQFIFDASSLSSVDDIASLFDEISIEPITNVDERKRIFRFLRHSWRIPYNTTPGRTLSFLIRLGHLGPVIGIMSLASPVMWMSNRDEALGFETFQRLKLMGKGGNTVFENKGEWVARWKKTGLVDDGKVVHPHSDQFTVSELVVALQNSLIRRLEQLPLEHLSEIVSTAELSEFGVDWKSTKPEDWEGSREPIGSTTKRNDYVKRRRIAEKCIQSLRALNSIQGEYAIAELWDMLHGDHGSVVLLRALQYAVREQKTKIVSGNLAEMSICGAIPPFNEIRVGKLIAMLAMSSEVATCWEDTYSKSISEIASKLAGRPITRNSTLAAISTTGLYGNSNKQYDRIRIGEGSSIRRFQHVGTTGENGTKDKRGPSTLTISDRTWGLVHKYAEINGLLEGTSGRFGEGTSARIRRLQAVINHAHDTLNIDGKLFEKKLIERITMNPFSRSVHIAKLSRYSTRFILGIDDKLRQLAPLPTADDIIDLWKDRWLLPLLSRDEGGSLKSGADILQSMKSVDLETALPPFD